MHILSVPLLQGKGHLSSHQMKHSHDLILQGILSKLNKTFWKIVWGHSTYNLFDSKCLLFEAIVFAAIQERQNGQMRLWKLRLLDLMCLYS